jgi:hypothetical protein
LRAGSTNDDSAHAPDRACEAIGLRWADHNLVLVLRRRVEYNRTVSKSPQRFFEHRGHVSGQVYPQLRVEVPNDMCLPFDVITTLHNWLHRAAQKLRPRMLKRFGSVKA